MKPFLDSSYSTPCIRCGAARLVSRQWKERIRTIIGVTVIVHTETVCPNRDCQILVEEGLEVKRVKREAIEQRKIERMNAHRSKKKPIIEHKAEARHSGRRALGTGTRTG